MGEALAKALRQAAHVGQRRAVAGGIVRRGHEDQTGVIIHQGEERVEIEAEIRVEGMAAHFHAADLRLDGIDAEAGLEANHGMLARHQEHTDQHVDDLVRAVAHHHLIGADAVRAGQGRHQAGVAALGIAEGCPGVQAQGFLHQGRDAQGVLVAGHFDDLGQAVFLLNFGNGHAGNIGAQGGYFRAHGAGVHTDSRCKESLAC